MRRLLHASTVAVALALAAPAVYPSAFQGADADRVVPGGGVHVPGWKGKIPDALRAPNTERVINDSKLSGTPANMVINSGPPAIYWNPANTASGDYTVKATFHEPKVMSAMSHAHPYGVFIGGNKLDTAEQSFIYCLAYGANNRFLLRGFGPTVFQFGPSRQQATNPAVKVADANGSVTQEIAMSVKGDAVSCAINGTAVWTGTKADVVGAGKLTSTDGIFGIRVSHNTDVNVSGFGKS
jgi:hypothetical protein